MPEFLIREFVDGKMIGHPVEAETKEEAIEKFHEALPFLKEQESEEDHSPDVGNKPVPNKKLNGRKFLSLEFQCSSCGTVLVAVFKDGYLQIDPCPTCLGELEKMVEASKRFLERKR